MLSIAFCDDEPIMLEELFNVVKGYIDSKKVEFTADLFESGEEFVEKGVRCRKYDHRKSKDLSTEYQTGNQRNVFGKKRNRCRGILEGQTGTI